MIRINSGISAIDGHKEGIIVFHNLSLTGELAKLFGLHNQVVFCFGLPQSSLTAGLSVVAWNTSCRLASSLVVKAVGEYNTKLWFGQTID